MNDRAMRRLLPTVLTRNMVNTAITTAGAGTLTGAGLVGGVITRSGPTGAYTDTTDTATNIIAAMPGAGQPWINQSWLLCIRNTVAFTQTLSAGTGVTLSGLTVIPGLAVGWFLVTYTGVGAVTILGLTTDNLTSLPDAQYSTRALSSSTANAGELTGARWVTMNNSGATPGTYTTRTATQMFSDTPNAQVGQSYNLRVVNGQGTGVLTIGAGAGVTLTGTMTIATNTSRDFVVTFNSATTLTIQNVATGTFS